MNIRRRQERDERLIKYLNTPMTYETTTGKPIYPTLNEAAFEFDLSVAQVHRIKKRLVGLNKLLRKEEVIHGQILS